MGVFGLGYINGIPRYDCMQYQFNYESIQRKYEPIIVNQTQPLHLRTQAKYMHEQINKRKQTMKEEQTEQMIADLLGKGKKFRAYA